jgi:hypothetical protein
MHFIVYTSEYTGRKEDIDLVLDDIVKTSKINNPTHGITGLLFYHNQRFIQVLEGERDALEELMSIIEQDNRHKNIERILDQPIKKRGFTDWNMDSCNLSADQDIDPEELIRIRDAYKKHLLVDSKLLVEFYKAMLVMSG